MTRVLTVAHARVLPEHEAEYIRTVRTLAELGGSRGQSLWLFRSASDPQRFLEFSESRTEMSHRSRASRTDYELKLERRLQVIAEYAPGGMDLWEEVPGPAPQQSSGWEPESEDEGR